MITIITAIIALILIMVSGMSEAFMDKLQFHYGKSVFANNPPKYYANFWNPKLSWMNKYKKGSTTEPKFWGSTTFFVFTTDAWHLFKFFKNTSMFIAIFFIGISSYNFINEINQNYIISIIIYTLIARAFYGLSFVLFFDKFLHVVDPFAYMKKGNSSPSNEIKSDWMDNINNN